jgi:hypothetical protein
LTALMASTVALALPGVQAADEIRDWSETATSALLGELYRAAAPDERIVAIRCADSSSMNADLATACSALRYELTDAMTRRRFDVVEPRDSFDAVTTWDHIDCGRDAAPRYLGWSVVEIRMTPSSRKRGATVSVAAVELNTRTVLHETALDRRALDTLRARPAPVGSGGAELTISRRDLREDGFASHLAEKLVCALKDLPEKSLLDGVSVRGTVSSPAHFEWTHNVAERLVVHLNRVLRSGYVRDGSATLAIEMEPLGAGSFRVVPSILRVDDATGGQVALIDGGSVCPGRECAIEIIGFLSPLLGDLRVFGDDHVALQTYLGRRSLVARLDPVASGEAIGRIVGQTPDAGTLVDRIRRGALVVHVAAAERETISLASFDTDSTDLQATLVNIGRELGISADAVRLSLQAVRRGGRDAAYLERIVANHDPRSHDDSDLPGIWRAWYDLAEPTHAPNFSGSPINGLVREVSESLWKRLELAVFAEPATP